VRHQLQRTPAMKQPTCSDSSENADSEWESTSTPNLYLRRSTKRYYARISRKGKRTFQSLRTKVRTVAEIKIAKIAGQMAQARLEAKPAVSDSSIRTMGDLKRVFLARVETADVKEPTKINWRNWIARLSVHWPGSFDATLPAHVSLDTVLKVRTALEQAVFKTTNGKTVRKGYRPSTVNQTLTALKMLLELAREHHLIFSSPFDNTSQKAFGGRIWLSKKTRKPQLPSRFDMERVFAEMARVPDPDRYDRGRLAFLRETALDVAEHARFLAFSGARLNEGNAACWEHIGTDSIMIHGTKSLTSERPVPIVPEMRVLLDEIRKRRVAQNLPLRGRILRIKDCGDALERACQRVGVPKLTHHHLRHYFITVCIESGVDIPTVARWVGHADGGALLMKTYAHLRDLHSTRMAQQVRFGAQVPASPPSAAPQSSVG
jgi:integrase